MRKPVIAIIGRPNVGKSTLVNRIVGSRKAIVDDQPGVTRDRSYYDGEWQGREFLLIDTGGLMPEKKAPEGDEFFAPLINHQIDVALDEADVVVFVVDALDGMTPLDKDIALKLHKGKKKIILAVNKIDQPAQASLVSEFYSLGLGEPLPMSAMHGDIGVGNLLDIICKELPQSDPEAEAEAENSIRIAILGRPNVGKSSILNTLLGQERTIVSNIPGTTRDAIDARLSADGQDFILVDTAGIRKKGKVDYGVELFSVDRAIKALKEADVTVMVLDATENQDTHRTFITDQDKRLAETAKREGKALIIVVNKWDLIENKTTQTTEEYKEDVIRDLPHARYAPVLFTSAVKKQRVLDILKLARHVYTNWQRRVSTNLVNQVILDAVQMSPPPSKKNRHVNILYATQASNCPPTFIVFANDAKLLQETYIRYLEKKLRESFEFEGTPIAIHTRSRDEKKSPTKRRKSKTS